MLALLAALSLATVAAVPAAPAGSAQPALSASQAAALRCGVVFAMAARLQADGSPAAAGWPPLSAKGREFFVRSAAQIMEDTGASRETIQALAAAQRATLGEEGAVAAAVPGCLALLGASGL